MLYITESCVGCAQCMFACRKGAIEVEGKAIIDNDVCSECMRCRDYCPLDAIRIVSE